MTNPTTLMVKITLMVLRVLVANTELLGAAADKRQQPGLLLAFGAAVLGRHSNVLGMCIPKC